MAGVTKETCVVDVNTYTNSAIDLGAVLEISRPTREVGEDVLESPEDAHSLSLFGEGDLVPFQQLDKPFEKWVKTAAQSTKMHHVYNMGRHAVLAGCAPASVFIALGAHGNLRMPRSLTVVNPRFRTALDVKKAVLQATEGNVTTSSDNSMDVKDTFSVENSVLCSEAESVFYHAFIVYVSANADNTFDSNNAHGVMNALDMASYWVSGCSVFCVEPRAGQVCVTNENLGAVYSSITEALVKVKALDDKSPIPPEEVILVLTSSAPDAVCYLLGAEAASNKYGFRNVVAAEFVRGNYTIVPIIL